MSDLFKLFNVKGRHFVLVIVGIIIIPFSTEGKLLPVPTEFIAKQVYSPDIDSLTEEIINDGMSTVTPSTPIELDVMTVVALFL